MMNTRIGLALITIILFMACKKTEPIIEPENPTCITYTNDTLMLLYPCDGQTDFTPDRFEWKTGTKGQALDGFIELWIKKVDSPFGLYSQYYWSTEDRSITSMTGDTLELLPNTNYEWYMAIRHDGNGLYFRTHKQTFVTGATNTHLPTVFQSYAGKYMVSDTFFQRSIVFTSSSQFHLELQPPIPKANTTLHFSIIPDEPITLYNQDTITHMHLSIGSGPAYTVSVNHKGAFYWSDGNYYTPSYVAGNIRNDSIWASKGISNNSTGEGRWDAYKGVKQ